MKKFYVLCIVLLTGTKLLATHNISGEIFYTHLTGFTYQVNLITYTKTSSNIDRPTLTMFYGDGTADSIQRISLNSMIFDMSQNVYSTTHTYPGAGSYVLHFEDLNRNGGIVNIPNSVNTAFYTEALLTIDAALAPDNSPRFLQPPVVHTINNSPLTHNVTAFDPDGDCLTFELVSCKGAFGQACPGYYVPNFVAIDSLNGELTWTNPVSNGQYNFAAKVNEWRNGMITGYVIRDFSVYVNSLSAPQFYFSGQNGWQTDVSGNYSYTLNSGDSLQLNLSYTDSLSSVMDINSYSDLFLSANPPLFLKTVSAPTIASQFNWTPNATNVRSAPYIVTFRGTSDDRNSDLSLLIYVLDITTIPCSFTTSINEPYQYVRQNQIFPNPFADKFSITGLEQTSMNHLLIYDVTGRLIKDITLENSTSEIDASDLPVGFFLFELRNDNAVLTKGKLLKK